MRILDGGRQKWIGRGPRADDRDAARRDRRDVHGQRRATSRSGRTATTCSGARSASGRSALVDVRTPAGVRGRADRAARLRAGGRAARGPHPDRAQSIPWATAVRDDGTFKSADELRELYGGKGVTPDKKVTRVLPDRRAQRPHVVRPPRAARLRGRSRTTTARGRSGETSSTCRSKRVPWRHWPSDGVRA